MQELPELVVLGLLAEKPRHGYELKQIFESYMNQLVRLSGSTLYYLLGRLERKGLVKKRQKKLGPRPPRQVYHLTGKGRARFRELLHRSFFFEDRPYFAFNAGLYFLKYADPQEVLTAISQKKGQLESYRQVIRQIERDYPVAWPFYYAAIKRQAELLIDALAQWYEELEKEVRRYAERAGSGEDSAKRGRESLRQRRATPPK